MAMNTPRKADEKDKRSESFGPIALMRHVKDDGRALILYTAGEHIPAEGRGPDERTPDEPGDRPR